MTTTNINNQQIPIKNLQVALASVQQSSKSAEASGGNVSSPQAPKSEPSKLPSRQAPNASDVASLQDGLDNINITNLLFSVEVLVRLLFEIALKQRDVNRISNMQDITVAQSMGDAAAEDLREEATMSLAGSVVMASMQVAGAATVIGGSIRTAKINDTMTVTNKMMTYQAASQAFGATGTLGQGGFTAAAKTDEANKAMHDAMGTKAKSLGEIESDDAKDESQLLQSIIQMMEKLEETRHQAVNTTA